MRLGTSLKTLTAALSVAIVALPAWSNASQRAYGANAPFDVEDLPPGLLRSALEDLPDAARSRALQWLHSFDFPAADVAQLRADPNGGIYYVDPKPAGEATQAAEPAPVIPSTTEVFALHSKPGASRVIFIDVDGAVISGTAWNSGRADPLYAKPFDTDNNPQSFSESERNAIAEIWHRVAEDFAAFDVDVTTEEPVTFNSQTGHLLITDDVDEYGNAMPSQGAGGVAYVNPWGGSNFGYYSPAFVYANNLGPDFPPFLAEAGSHEIGHNLGLSHDGTSTSGYYSGHGSGWVSWGPVMGTGYRDNVSQWSKGEYAGANNTQDDIAIITNKLTARADDHGNGASSATLLQQEADGSVIATTPQTDPFNTNPANKGIINSRTDVDVFLINTGAGTLDLSISPSWLAWRRDSNGRGTNLDIHAALYDAQGALVTESDPLDNTDAQITASVAAGSYTLEITGVGNSVSPYTDYGSQGQYFISGFVPTAEPDTEAPTPNPMGWSSPPAAGGHDSMTMEALAATDNSGGTVQYYFVCVSGGSNCNDSGWQTSASYTATSLAPETTYEWQVKARDISGNETALSSVASATTDAAPAAPAAPTALVATDGTDGTAALSWSDQSTNESGFEIQRESYHPKRKRWQSTTLITTTAENVSSFVDASGSGTYRYRVRAVNSIGASAYTAWSEVAVTEASSGGGGNDGSCKGGPKKCPR